MSRVCTAFFLLGILLGILTLLAGCGSSHEKHIVGRNTILISPNGYTIKLGETKQFTARVYDGKYLIPGAVVTWKVSDTTIGTLAADGTFSAAQLGTCTITAKYENAEDRSVNVTVVSLDFNPQSLNIRAPQNANNIPLGSTAQFTAVCHMSSGEDIEISPTWRLEPEGCDIDGTGLFTAEQLGTYTVHAEYELLSATATVTVVNGDNPPPPPPPPPTGELRINTPDGADLNNLHTGDIINFTVSGTDLPVTWSVTGGIGSITSNGVFTAKQIGSGTVKVTDGERWAEIAVRVVAKPVPPDEPLPPIRLLVPNGVDLNALYINDTVYFGVINAQGPVTWSVNGTAGTITQTGALTATALGSGTVTVTDGQTSDSVGFTVVAIPPLVTGKIAYVRVENLYANLALLNTDGGYSAITSGRQFFSEPSWAPGGNLLAFKGEASPYAGLCTIADDGSGIDKLRDCIPVQPAWSPDGSKVAYVNGIVGASELLTVSGTTGELIKKISLSLTGVMNTPRWSADGNTIAFCVNQGATEGIYLVNADGGNLRQIVVGTVLALDWNTASNALALRDDNNLYVVSATGGVPQRVYVGRNKLTGSIAWTADGKWIIFAEKVGTRYQLKMVNTTTHRVAHLTTAANVHSCDPTWIIR